MTGWWAGVRVAARIARRDALRARGRTVLVAAMIGLPVLAATAGATLVHSQDPTHATYARAVLGDGDVVARVDAYVGPGVEQDVRGTSGSSTGEEEPPSTVRGYEAELRRALPDGVTLARAVVGSARVSVEGGLAERDDRVLELPPGAPDVDALHPVQEGRLPTGTGEAAVAHDLAGALGVGPGDRVAVRAGAQEPVLLDVTGVLAPAPAWAAPPALVARTGAVLPAPVVRSLTGREAVPRWYVVGSEPVTWDHVRALNAAGSFATSRAVLLDPPADASGATAPDRSAVALGAAVAAMGLLEAVLLIGPAFAVGARRRERHLALLAAAGGSRRTLRDVVLLGGVVIGLLASAVGLAAGVLVAAAVQAVAQARGSFLLPDLRVPVAVVAAVPVATLIAGAAAWLPARRASRLDVVAVLGGRRADVAVRRRVPLAGLTLVLLGGAAALAGATGSRTSLLVAGVLAVEVGVVAASGALLVAAARLAPYAGVAGRFALRDAVRQRGRTAPAVAAVLAAVAGVVAGSVYVASSDAHEARRDTPMTADGVVSVAFAPGDVDASPAVTAATAAALRATLPVDDVVPVQVAVWVERAAVHTVRAAHQECPLWGAGAPTTEQRRAAASDPRCDANRYHHAFWQVGQEGLGSDVLVDDGTVATALGLPPAVGEALAAGLAVVPSPVEMWADGTARVRVDTYGEGAGERTRAEVDVPAVAVPMDGSWYRLVLPPGALEPLGLRAAPAGVVATTTRMPTTAEEDRARAEVDHAVPATVLHVQRPDVPAVPVLLWVLVAAAAVVAVGATGMAVALAGVESRPDLATLSAVGAAPRVRRRVAAAQAGVVVGIGVPCGAVAGLVLGAVLVLAARHRSFVPDLTWQVHVPWDALAAVVVGVPALAVGASWLVSRSRLPMVRRVVG